MRAPRLLCIALAAMLVAGRPSEPQLSCSDDLALLERKLHLDYAGYTLELLTSEACDQSAFALVWLCGTKSDARSMLHPIISRGVSVLGLIGVLSCGNAPTHPVGCLGAVTINVSPSVDLSGRPQFDWSPRCGITNLTVIVLPNGIGDPAVMWDISAPEDARIAPPVIYGRVPAGATAGIAAQPLQTGGTYRVSIISTTGGDVLDAEGEKTFVR